RAAGIAADAKTAECCAVKAAILGENLRPACDQAGHDERLIIRLAATVDEEALAHFSRRSLSQRIRQRDSILRQELRRNATRLLRLPLNSGDHPLVGVAKIDIEELGQEVDVPAALAVVEIDALGMIEFQDGVFALLDRPR